MSDAPTPEVDCDIRTYPNPEHLELIQFDGCTVGVIATESYEELYEKARRLERERDEAREALGLELKLPTHLLDIHAIADERDSLRARVAELEGSRWEAVHSGGHWWIADEKTGDLIEMIAGPESEIAEAIASAHNFSITGKCSA